MLDLSHELHPDVIITLKRAEAGIIHKAASLHCQFCGMSWSQYTREDASDFAPDLDHAYAEFRTHVTSCTQSSTLPGLH